MCTPEIKNSEDLLNGREPLNEINTNSSISPVSSKRLLRSGSTFGEAIAVDYSKARHSDHTASRRKPCMKKEDNIKLSENSQHFQKEPSPNNEEIAGNNIDECFSFGNSDKINSIKRHTIRSHSIKERQRDEFVSKTLTSKIEMKCSQSGEKRDSFPQNRSSDKDSVDYNMKSLLHFSDAQVNQSLSPASSSILPEAKTDDLSINDNHNMVTTVKSKTLLTTDQQVDFTQVQPIRDETFYVSLSNDESKELSMLTTTKGTVRVNSAISKKQYEVTTPSATLLRNDTLELKNENGKNEIIDVEKMILKTVISPESIVTSSKGLSSQDDFSKIKTSLLKEDEAIERQYSQDTMDKTQSGHENNTRDTILYSDSNDEKITDKVLLLNDNNLLNDSFESVHRQQKGGTSPTSKHGTHFPLMEEILTQQSSRTLNKKMSNEKTPDNMSDVKSKTIIYPVTPTPACSVSLISVDKKCCSSKRTKHNRRSSSKNRSADNETSSSSITRQNSVISTMKPIDKSLRSALGSTMSVVENKQSSTVTATPDMSSSSSSSSLSSKSFQISLLPSPEKNAKVQASSSSSSGTKRVSSSSSSLTSSSGKSNDRSSPKPTFTIAHFPQKKMHKKGKDFSKAKSSMSVEVMDGIIRSIEETVSRIRESADQENSTEASKCRNANKSVKKRDANNNRRDEKSVIEVQSKPSSSKKNHAKENMSVLKHKSSSCSIGTTKLYKNKSVKSAKKRSIHSRSKKDSDISLVLKLGEKDDRKGFSVSKGDNSSISIVAAATTSTTATTATSKRFRKKTRKAEEALGDCNIFWDDEWPVKKFKVKKRVSNTTTTTTSSSITTITEDSTSKRGQRRSRRGHEDDNSSPDPVLEEHAFILWASENRSELEMKFPNVSTSELDAVLSAKWCDVTSCLKTKYFSRAKEAFSDDDRQRIWSNHSSYGDLDSDVLCGFIMDRDPVFSDFVRMPVHRQRDLLRKWLKFFQKMMPRKEYVEFIASFKRACGRDDFVTKSGKPKRTHMRSIDPSHYKMLFDLIRLSKPRVLEVYKERRGKKNMISSTYRLMLKHIVGNQPWPHMDVDCCSYLLTELFQDLDEIDRREEEEKQERKKAAMIQGTTMDRSLKVATEDKKGGGNDNKQIIPPIKAGSVIKSSPCVANFVVVENDRPCDFHPNGEGTVLLDAGGGNADWSMSGVFDGFGDDDDLAVLNTDFAQHCLYGSAQLAEIPVLDQQLLDDVFLSPGVIIISPNVNFGSNINNCPTNLSNQHMAMMNVNYSKDHAEVTFTSAPHHSLIVTSASRLASRESSIGLNHRVSQVSNHNSLALSTPTCFIQPSLSSSYPTTIVSDKVNRYLHRKSPCIKSSSQQTIITDTKSEYTQKPLLRYHGETTAMETIRRPSTNVSSAMDVGISMKCVRLNSFRQFSNNSHKMKMPLCPYPLPLEAPQASPRMSISRNTSQVTSLTHNNNNNNNITNNAFPIKMPIRSPRVINDTPGCFPLDTNAGSKSMSIVGYNNTNPMFHNQPVLSRAQTLHHMHGSSSPLITSLSSMKTVRSRTASISYQAQQQGSQSIPCCRSKVLYSSGFHQGSHTGYRRHSFPINSSVSKLYDSSGIHNNNHSLHQQQNKVCLPSQSLKIPIAKLKGSRKTSFVRNSLKAATNNNNISFENSIDLTFDQPSPLLSREFMTPSKPSANPSENQTCLAKVLKSRESDKNFSQESLSSPSSSAISSAISCVKTAFSTPPSSLSIVSHAISSQSLNKESNNNPSINNKSPRSRLDSNSKVQLISIIGKDINNGRNSYINCINNSSSNSVITSKMVSTNSTPCLSVPSPIRSRMSSPQKAIVVNPLYIHRYPTNTSSRIGGAGHNNNNNNSSLSGHLNNIVRKVIKPPPPISSALSLTSGGNVETISTKITCPNDNKENESIATPKIVEIIGDQS